MVSLTALLTLPGVYLYLVYPVVESLLTPIIPTIPVSTLLIIILSVPTYTSSVTKSYCDDTDSSLSDYFILWLNIINNILINVQYIQHILFYYL